MHTQRNRHPRRMLATLVTAGLVTFVPAAPGYADDGPPDLPTVGNTCVGASPVTDNQVPWAEGLLAPASVWPLTMGAGILVAVLDTGVSATAPGLDHAVRRGIDVVSGGGADTDCRGRGTALAGLIAARPIAGSAIVGLAPASQILPIRIVDGDGRVPTGALAAGVRAATAAGAQVIMLGTGLTTPDTALRDAVDAAIAHDEVVIAPVAGNGQGDPGQAIPVWYPAAYDPVIAVGGINHNGAATEVVADTASLDLVAPSVDVVSVGPVGGHYSVGGSSVAAAYVAGAAALVRSYHPDLTPAQVAQRLEQTAQAPPIGRGSTALGAGTVDPYAAVAELDPGQVDAPLEHEPVAVVPPAPPAPGPAAGLAGRFAGGTAAAAVLALIAVAIVRRGRRRGWRA